MSIRPERPAVPTGGEIWLRITLVAIAAIIACAISQSVIVTTFLCLPAPAFKLGLTFANAILGLPLFGTMGAAGVLVAAPAVIVIIRRRPSSTWQPWIAGSAVLAVLVVVTVAFGAVVTSLPEACRL